MNTYKYKLDIKFAKKYVKDINTLIDALSERFSDLNYSKDKRTITFSHVGTEEKKVRYDLPHKAVLYVECDDPIVRDRYEFKGGEVVDKYTYLNFFEAGTFWN